MVAQSNLTGDILTYCGLPAEAPLFLALWPIIAGPSGEREGLPRTIHLFSGGAATMDAPTPSVSHRLSRARRSLPGHHPQVAKKITACVIFSNGCLASSRRTFRCPQFPAAAFTITGIERRDAPSHLHHLRAHWRPRHATPPASATHAMGEK